MKLRMTLNHDQIAKFIEDVMEDFRLKRSDTIETLLDELRPDDDEEDDDE